MTAGSWRAADLRGDRGVPASVAAVVRHVHLGLVAARAAESLLLGVAAGCAAMSAAVLSGHAAERVDLWLAAAAPALACALAWWLVHRPSERDVARRIDARLRHQGALVTAWERERAGDASPLVAWLDRRVRARLRLSESRRALLPSLAVPVVVPLLAVAALATALELARGGDEPRADPRALADGLAGRLEAAWQPALNAGLEGEMDLEAARSVRALARDARALEARLAHDDRAGALAQLDELDGRLGELAQRVPADAPFRRDVEAARAWADAARARLADEAAEGGSGLTGSGEDGKLPGSGAPVEPGEGGPGGLAAGGDGLPVLAPAPSDAGTASAARWWPAHHDAVVRRWFEAAGPAPTEDD